MALTAVCFFLFVEVGEGGPLAASAPIIMPPALPADPPLAAMCEARSEAAAAAAEPPAGVEQKQCSLMSLQCCCTLAASNMPVACGYNFWLCARRAAVPQMAGWLALYRAPSYHHTT
jgi:hypothetical protein